VTKTDTQAEYNNYVSVVFINTQIMVACLVKKMKNMSLSREELHLNIISAKLLNV